MFWVVSNARECAKVVVLLYNVHCPRAEVEVVKCKPDYDDCLAEMGHRKSDVAEAVAVNCKNVGSLELLLVGYEVSSSVVEMVGQELESQQIVVGVVVVVVKHKNDNLVVMVMVKVMEAPYESDDQAVVQLVLGVKG